MKDKKPNILLIEDEASSRQLITTAFGGIYRIIYAPNTRTALIAMQNQAIDLIVLDLFLEGGNKLDGLTLIKPLKEHAPQTPIIVWTKDPNSQTTVDAIRRGADDFIRKNELDIPNVKLLFDKHLNNKPTPKKEIIIKEEKVSTNNNFNFIGETPRILKIKTYLKRLSTRPNITILLTGESGVGKEVAAKYAHQCGARKNQAFEAVHLANLTESIIESRLFGHKKGSFTGAKTDMKGAFEKAHNGVLFLDEIGEINSNTQTQLLRFLEDKIINPIGGDAIKIDVQIIAATNKNLQKEVQAGRFRQDLFYRLNQFPLEIPPLRERKEDIPALIQFYLKKQDINQDQISPAVIQLLGQYNYPGNVREMVNIIKGLSIKALAEDLEQIDESLLPVEVRYPNAIATSATISERPTVADQAIDAASNPPLSVEAQQARLSLAAIEKALANHRGKKGLAAKELKLSMDNLRYRINKHYEAFPQLFKDFPLICKRYKNIVS